MKDFLQGQTVIIIILISVLAIAVSVLFLPPIVFIVLGVAIILGFVFYFSAPSRNSAPPHSTTTFRPPIRPSSSGSQNNLNQPSGRTPSQQSIPRYVVQYVSNKRTSGQRDSTGLIVLLLILGVIVLMLA